MSGGNVQISAKQFLAIVGDESGEIRSQLVKVLPCDEPERAIIIENNYYRAEIGIQHFASVTAVADGIAHEKVFPAIFVEYKGLDLLQSYSESFKSLNIDTKVIVASEPTTSEEASQLETWAVLNSFDVVHLFPSEEQKKVAETIREKVGIARLAECLHVCDWPFRKAKIPKTDNAHLDRMLKLLEDKEGESNVEHFSMDIQTADAMFDEYLRLRNLFVGTHPRPFPGNTPEMQHAERIHLPDSPPDDIESANQDNNNANTNQDNNSEKAKEAATEETVSADFELKCSQSGQNNTASGNLPDLAPPNNKTEDTASPAQNNEESQSKPDKSD